MDKTLSLYRCSTNMASTITLPVQFDDGTIRNVLISGNDRTFSISINDVPAGDLLFSADKNEWQHTGVLSKEEQRQIAGFIQNYTDTEWDN